MEQPISTEVTFSYVVLKDNPNATVGDYIMIEWANPSIPYLHGATTVEDANQLMIDTFTEEDILPVFKTSEYMMTPEGGIRTSKQLNELYHSQYVPMFADRYTKFKAFQTFNPSYNFEIMGTSYDPVTNTTTEEIYILDDAGRVPEYLQAMKPYILNYDTQLLAALDICKFYQI